MSRTQVAEKQIREHVEFHSKPGELRDDTNVDCARHNFSNLNASLGAQNSYLHLHHLMRNPTEFSCAIRQILEDEVETQDIKLHRMKKFVYQ